MKTALALASLAALGLAGCATEPVPTGPMSVVIKHPFNTLTSGRIEAIVEEDGTFANGWREGNSSVALYGLLTPAKRGSYEVSFHYQATIARAPSVVDAKSLQATVIARPNDPQPIGEILIKKDGSRHYGAADDISFELRLEESAPGPQ